MSQAKKRKLVREEEVDEARRQEQLKEERSLRKGAVTNQTKPKRGRPASRHSA